MAAKVKNETVVATAAPAGEGFQEVAPAEVAGGKKKSKRAKKEKVKRSLWGVRDEKGNLVEKIAAGAAPANYDPKVHLPLRRKDYAQGLDYLRANVERTRAAFQAAEKELKDEAALGNEEQRTRVRQAKQLSERLAKMKKEMSESGMTDEQIAQFLS